MANNQTKYRKHVRVQTYDYSEDGAYFVTLVTADRKPYFRDYRLLVEQTIRDLPSTFPGLTIDIFVVMDNHIHLILLFNNIGKTLGQVVGALKSLIYKTLRDQGFNKMIWQHNYFEHIIRSEKTLYRLRKYIADNPAKEEIDATIFYLDEPLT